jgi:hypothetical protein
LTAAFAAGERSDQPDAGSPVKPAEFTRTDLDLLIIDYVRKPNQVFFEFPVIFPGWMDLLMI